MTPRQSIRRPTLVWLVASYSLLSSVLAVAAVLLALSAYQMPTAAWQKYVSHLNWVDHSLNLISALVNASAAIGIFMLRRSAPVLFSAVILLLLVRFARATIATSWLDAVGSYGALGTVVGVCLNLACCWYAWCLLRRGFLR